ncbi:hypothetical protein MRX96_011006 [Rhipicephalus microplus]
MTGDRKSSSVNIDLPTVEDIGVRKLRAASTKADSNEYMLPSSFGAPYSRGPCQEVEARDSFDWCAFEHFVWKELDLMDVSVETRTQSCRRPVAHLLMLTCLLWASLLGHHFESPNTSYASSLKKCREDVCLIKVYWDSLGDAYCAVALSWLLGLYKYFCNA